MLAPALTARLSRVACVIQAFVRKVIPIAAVDVGTTWGGSRWWQDSSKRSGAQEVFVERWQL